MPTDGKPKNGIVRQLFSYGGVSAMQTFVEFGVFAVLQLAGLPFRLANAVAVFCSGSFNYVMNTRCCPRMVGAISSARIVRRWIIVGNIGVPALFECASPVVRACRARRMRHAVS